MDTSSLYYQPDPFRSNKLKKPFSNPLFSEIPEYEDSNASQLIVYSDCLDFITFLLLSG